MPGHARLNSSSLVTSAPSASSKTSKISNARVPQLYRHAVSDQLPLAPQYSESSEANDPVAVAVHPALIDLGQGD
jgi:hypothetical protein